MEYISIVLIEQDFNALFLTNVNLLHGFSSSIEFNSHIRFSSLDSCLLDGRFCIS